MLLLRRGYGRQVEAGRLLLQKLDYLQAELVKRVGGIGGGHYY